MSKTWLSSAIVLSSLSVSSTAQQQTGGEQRIMGMPEPRLGLGAERNVAVGQLTRNGLAIFPDASQI